MTSFDPSQAFRYQTDAMLTTPSILGVAQYQCNLIQVSNAQVAFGDTGGVGTRTSTRITVGAMFDGYLSYAPGDGYLNPMVKDTKGQVAILAAQQLSEMEWILGPLVFPYTGFNDIYGNAITGGTDPNLFFPLSGSTNNLAIYVQLLGPGLNPNHGAFFKIQEMVLDQASNIYYKLRLVAVDEEP